MKDFVSCLLLFRLVFSSATEIPAQYTRWGLQRCYLPHPFYASYAMPHHWKIVPRNVDFNSKMLTSSDVQYIKGHNLNCGSRFLRIGALPLLETVLQPLSTLTQYPVQIMEVDDEGSGGSGDLDGDDVDDLSGLWDIFAQIRLRRIKQESAIVKTIKAIKKSKIKRNFRRISDYIHMDNVQANLDGLETRTGQLQEEVAILHALASNVRDTSEEQFPAEVNDLDRILEAFDDNATLRMIHEEELIMDEQIEVHREITSRLPFIGSFGHFDERDKSQDLFLNCSSLLRKAMQQNEKLAVLKNEIQTPFLANNAWYRLGKLETMANKSEQASVAATAIIQRHGDSKHTIQNTKHLIVRLRDVGKAANLSLSSAAIPKMTLEFEEAKWKVNYLLVQNFRLQSKFPKVLLAVWTLKRAEDTEKMICTTIREFLCGKNMSFAFEDVFPEIPETTTNSLTEPVTSVKTTAETTTEEPVSTQGDTTTTVVMTTSGYPMATTEDPCADAWFPWLCRERLGKRKRRWASPEKYLVAGVVNAEAGCPWYNPWCDKKVETTTAQQHPIETTATTLQPVEITALTTADAKQRGTMDTTSSPDDWTDLLFNATEIAANNSSETDCCASTDATEEITIQTSLEDEMAETTTVREPEGPYQAWCTEDCSSRNITAEWNNQTYDMDLEETVMRLSNFTTQMKRKLFYEFEEIYMNTKRDNTGMIKTSERINILVDNSTLCLQAGRRYLHNVLGVPLTTRRELFRGKVADLKQKCAGIQRRLQFDLPEENSAELHQDSAYKILNNPIWHRYDQNQTSFQFSLRTHSSFGGVVSLVSSDGRNTIAHLQVNTGQFRFELTSNGSLIFNFTHRLLINDGTWNDVSFEIHSESYTMVIMKDGKMRGNETVEIPDFEADFRSYNIWLGRKPLYRVPAQRSDTLPPKTTICFTNFRVNDYQVQMLYAKDSSDRSPRQCSSEKVEEVNTRNPL
ncbi:hypothetical protein CAPTEDRAFT_204858 [Capitella teleta]|uniref:Laminin G domain-containing protein n=1 Tax=Capitella teleta TaxID=283909 RepID=R7TUW1_CAPTE|nr:hypothetical protein CAPTEDRAFT_204858 [Capitella teleta]|eukprot:ELT97342.1 hypothetical protein CAPTEDRAFT_204858 [Capitella teleta]